MLWPKIGRKVSDAEVSSDPFWLKVVTDKGEVAVVAAGVALSFMTVTTICQQTNTCLRGQHTIKL